jgi:UDP-N-acetylglucosamine 2-epimerase (non-hydrolysing)
MIVFVYGTTAELIKLSPIMRELKERNLSYETWSTGQQFDELEVSAEVLGFGHVDFWIAKGFRSHSLTKILQVPYWLLTSALWFVKHRRLLRRRFSTTNATFIVHGDTMTTVIGAVFGRLLKQKVAHVEAGLRSNDWRNPFPEEIDRIIAARLCDIHFAPDDTAIENLKGSSGVVINTYGNTALDALRNQIQSSDLDSHGKHGLVLLHRSEFLRDTQLVKDTFSLIMHLATTIKIVVVADALSTAALMRCGLMDDLVSTPNLQVLEKQSHREFVKLVTGSKFIVTDSGGVQEECSTLGIPCFIHRKATERVDGLGKNCILTNMNVENLATLISNSSNYRFSSQFDTTSPTRVIVDYLQNVSY